MPASLAYPHHPQTGAPQALTADAIRAVAAQMRCAVISRQGADWALRTDIFAVVAARLEAQRLPPDMRTDMAKVVRARRWLRAIDRTER